MMTHRHRGSRISQIEYYLPARIETVHDLIRENPDWCEKKIIEKTGILKRHIAGNDETAADLAYKAAKKLLEKSAHAIDIEAIIFVSQSPDYFLPTTACLLQDRLGLSKKCMAFDVNQGCSGFVYGLSIANALIQNGSIENCLLLCADTYTRYVQRNDRTCRPLFGDGAAATLICSSEVNQIGPFVLGSDGSGAEKLIVKHGASRNREMKSYSPPHIFMDGAGVFMFTMSQVPECVASLLRLDNAVHQKYDHYFFHQASKVVLDNIVRSTGIDDNKVFRNYQDIGNTVSASIPIALKDALNGKIIKNGENLVLVGFGVGLSWGACAISWG